MRALDDTQSPTDQALAEVQDLTISYRAGRRRIPVLSQVSLSIPPGEAVALVGESGSGKSTLAAALLGQLRPGSEVVSGSVRVDSHNVFQASKRELLTLRRRTVAFVPQNAGHSLTPTMRVGDQIAEVLRFCRAMDRESAAAETIRLFGLVRLPQPAVLVRRYAHELSGGQQQRVAMAMAVATNPRLLVLDEPTTGLDVVTQAGILTLLRSLRAEFRPSLVFVSHDLGVVASICERIAVLYAGRVVETGATEDIFRKPAHPYTRGLLATVPRLRRPGLPAGMPGLPPAPGAVAEGCSFADRCGFVQDRCRVGVHPPLAAVGDPAPAGAEGGRWSACLRAPEVLGSAQGVLDVRTRGAREIGAPLLKVTGLEVDYRKRPDPESGPTVHDVDLEVRAGEVVALVGESGSGKSTIAWTIAGLRKPTAGAISLGVGDPAPSDDDEADGSRLARSSATADLTKAAAHRSPDLRRRVQLIFQNPDTSLNPRRTVGDAVTRPITLFGLVSGRGQVQLRRDTLFGDVGLDRAQTDRLPSQLSGGQRQRVGIARAIAADPTLVLADEVVSALDVSVQASVLRLLDDLRAEHGLAYLFISHDLAVVRGIADRVIVLYLGRVCEEGPVERVFRGPNHPYTHLLIGAVLEPDPDIAPPTRSDDDEPESAPPPRGCPFARRCPHHIAGLCDTTTPPWLELGEGHRIRCHLPMAELPMPELQPAPLPQATP